MAAGHDERKLDPGARLILEELRDLRLEMRADRQRADEDRRQADEERRQERLRSDERFEHLMRDFQQDSARREAVTQKAFNDVRAVGLSIAKTLNRHTRILERIEGKLGARGNGRPGQGNGRRA
jgi:hypothetical protein